MGTSYAYFKKQIIPLEDAKIGVMTHALHYGTGVFEGIRGNWNNEKKQMYIFRLKEHYTRLLTGAKVLKMNLPYTVDELCKITIDLIKKCGFKEDIYIRPLAYKSSETFGVRLHNLDCDLLIVAIPWGRYIDKDTCHCCVSTWRRPDDNVMPPQLKSTGIYLNNAFTKTEAVENGFDEGIMLTPDGHVSEGSGENLFIVRKGKLITPPICDSILDGITRNSVMELAEKELGLEVLERSIDRVELYMAEECFLTGTAAHLTPVSEVDHRKVGNGEIGPLTAKLKDLYFEAIKGHITKYSSWCTPVYNL
ncbi:Branched-chain-amino-acid aminotransferase [bioreactor metagenome]|uniref:branched-chain-amino-acid transaminase n=1 Tax=bioreactor metagenome TaxID=1076179 RepID=A0A644T3T3_9ZZZZ|nr:branched-chain amino acid transaminase [Dehalococcoides sp.]MEA4878720.1 branched-chain amino acid transaminase [Dehalococcoides mccartyi]